MTVGSKINPNFPIPGIDQSSKGFRDNFGIIKHEIEDIQGKKIQLVGSLVSDPIEIGSGTQDVIIPVAVNLSNVQAAGYNLAVQYNFNGLISGSQMFWDNDSLGINTNNPQANLDVVGNLKVLSQNSNNTTVSIGSGLLIDTTTSATNLKINLTDTIIIDHATRNVGIGTYPSARFEIATDQNDVAVYHAYKNNSDNSVRFSTTPINATIGLVLEQRNANSVGGVRLDQNGNISIHVGESMDANLSDASRVIVILPNNNVGIGSMSPQNQLDVSGNASVSGHIGIGTNPTLNSVTISGNLELQTQGSAAGIFFADGSFQTVAGGGGTTASGNRDITVYDAGRYIISTTAGSETITVPNDATLNFPIGGRVNIVLNGTGSITLNPQAPVALYLAGIGTPGTRTLAAYAVATLVKINTNTWYVSGDGVS